MRFEITGRWEKEFEHDGMLYCAQRIEEMLMIYTSHLYKVPMYNTFLLAYEFMHVYSTVETKSIDQSHLKNIMEEFIDSFSSDIIVKQHFSQSQVKYFVSRLTGSNLPEQRKIMHYLIHAMSDYPNWCIDVLKNAVAKPKEKKNIEKALRSYVPMIIGMEYHPQAVYKECKKVFSKCHINSLDALDTFLDKFTGADIEYTVYLSVDKKIEKFKKILESRLGISFTQDECSKKLHYDANSQICVSLSESALDVNGAARRAYERFNLFMKYYKFLGNRDQKWCGDKCLVKDSDNNMSFPHIGSERYFYSQDYDDTTLGHNSERVITKLLENAGQNDFFKIDRLIRAHNTALSSRDINNAFLNLWSMIEIIGVDEFGGDTSKIKQVIQNIVPVLKRNYVKRIVEELHDYLKANLQIDDYSAMIKAVIEEGSDEYKIACLVSLSKYEETRKKVYIMLKNYPLLRSRISQLNEDVFKKKKELFTELNRYGQRLIWHIQRLYRVRNSIIHSGEPEKNMVYLVEHLHSYVDEVLLDIIDRMTRSCSLGTIANVLLDAQLFMDTIEKEYTKDEEFQPSDIKMIMD